MVKYAFVKNHVEENDNILKKEEENNIKIVLDHFGIRCINATIKTEYDTSL